MSSAQVPKQLYGYTLQFTECVSALLQAPAGTVISAEVFEDVGVQSEGGDTEAIQVKAGTGANPISDGSIELWKTFRNWIDQCNSLMLNPARTKFTMYVNSGAKGKLCTMMSLAVDSSDIDGAITKVREFFTDKRTGKLRKSLADEVKGHLTVVLDPLNAALLKLIIRNFSHRAGSGSSYVDLFAQFRRFPIAEGVLELAMLYIVGWTKKRLEELIEANQPAKIDRDEFWQSLTTYCEKATLQPYLIRFAFAPTPEQIDAETRRIYVRQLELIESTKEEQVEAVTDYLSAKAYAIQYMNRGLLNETSLTEFTNDLERLWRFQKLGLESEGIPRTDTAFGRALLSKCMLQNVLLQGAQTPAVFTSGCFHDLADGKSIGWHPRFLTMLESL